jgi:integrase
VFASDVGTPLDHDNVKKRFKRALQRAGLPSTTRLHDLRHGETVPTVSEYLGHASPAVTMAIYAHAVPGSGKRAASRLGAILRSTRPEPEVPQEASVTAS